MRLALRLVAVLLAVCFGLWIARYRDTRIDARVRAELDGPGGATPPRFDPADLADLPEPVRRYFAFSLEPGAEIRTVVDLEMEGRLGLGDLDDPRYVDMTAHQRLAPPHGLVWSLSAVPISGSDGATATTSWTRFWLGHTVPIVRAGGDADHLRSSFGRIVAEAVFWAPASLLPSGSVTWEARGENGALATVRRGDLEQAVDLVLDEAGQPVEVVIERWTNANPEKEYRLQPFGGIPSDYAWFDGQRIATRVEGGNGFGTESYFPFFQARITSARFR